MVKKRRLRTGLIALIGMLAFAASLGACSEPRLDIAAARCSLALPRGWKAERIPAPFFMTDEAYGLLSPGWAAVIEEEGSDYQIGEYPIYASVYSGSIAASGADYGWSFEEGQWCLEGRELSEAVFSKGDSFDLLRGSSVVGLRAREGGEYPSSVAATAFVAVLDGGKGKIIILVADPFFADEKTFDAIVEGCVFH